MSLDDRDVDTIAYVSKDSIVNLTLDQIVDNYIDHEYFRNYFNNSFYKLFDYVKKGGKQDKITKYYSKFVSDNRNIKDVLKNYLNGFKCGPTLLLLNYDSSTQILSDTITKDFLDSIFLKNCYRSNNNCVTKYINFDFIELVRPNLEHLVIKLYKMMALNPNHLVESKDLVVLIAAKRYCFKLMRYLLDNGGKFITKNGELWKNSYICPGSIFECANSTSREQISHELIDYYTEKNNKKMIDYVRQHGLQH